MRFLSAWAAAVIALVTGAVGLLVDRGATWILLATVSGFAAIMLVGSGLFRRWRGSPSRPSAG